MMRSANANSISAPLIGVPLRIIIVEDLQDMGQKVFIYALVKDPVEFAHDPAGGFDENPLTIIFTCDY